MMKIRILSITLLVFLSVQQVLATDSTRTLIIFFDGLRPDYITPAFMPNLYRFSLHASQSMSHHSIYPTVTRVNATSYSTGCYPMKHGILGNTIYFPELRNGKIYNTGNVSDLVEADSLLDHKMVAAVSMGQILKEAGKTMMVFSSGSTGQAFLQDHSRSGPMINTDMILPESFRELIFKEIGPVPTAESTKAKRHTWITNALIRFGLTSDGPLVNAIWYSDPDGAAHSHGIGSDLAVESLKIVDEEFGRILDHLDKSALRDRYNIIVSTDHGFVTHTGKESLTTFLINKGFKKSQNSDDIIVAGGAIYLAVPDSAKVRKIVYELQQTPNVGAIFTRSRNQLSSEGVIEGTLSFATIHWDFNSRTPDILVDVNWSDDANTQGYKGSTTSMGVAGHGSLSPYETNIRLLVDGPGFKKGQLSKAPSANIDIAPTVLSLHKFKVPQHMDGRVLNELMVHGTANENRIQKIGNEVITVANQVGNTRYTLKLHRYTYMGKIYIDHAQTIRTVK